MNDAEFARQLARVKERTNVWVEALRLWNWDIDYHFYRGPIDKEPPNCIACTDVKWEYMDAEISWNLEMVKDLSPEKLEKCVVHEFLHLVVNEMRYISDDYAKHEEHVVSTLTTMILTVRDNERVNLDEVE